VSKRKKESAVVELYWLCLGSQNITIHNVSVCGTSELAGKMWRWNEGIYSSLDLLSSITYPSSTAAAATLLAIFFFYIYRGKSIVLFRKKKKS
jgi:hypothetical protein